jgi:hypothetical protein
MVQPKNSSISLRNIRALGNKKRLTIVSRSVETMYAQMLNLIL